MRTLWCGSLLLTAIVLALLTACSPAEFIRRAAQPGKALQTAAPDRPVSSSSERAANLRPEIRRQLETENYLSALNMLRKGFKEGLSETALADEYEQALNGSLGKAELYQKQGLPDKAGELFRSAHDGYPKTEAVAKKIGLTPSEILARIDDCAEQLMERGLTAYRAGDLDGAIVTWKAIHAFSPRHGASRKALETAEVQRVNLEKVSTKN